MTLPTIPLPEQPVDHSTSTAPFQYAEDIHDAMKDVRYKTDSAYRDWIAARLEQTDPSAFSTSKKPVDEVVAAVQADRHAREDAAMNEAISRLDFSSVTPILDSGELISLMSDLRYTSPYGHAFREWVAMRLAITPEHSMLGIKTKVVDRQAIRHQVGLDD